MAQILLGEDEESIRQWFQVMLEDAGYGVEEAHTGAEGLQCYAAAPAGLVIMDMWMPLMEGRPLSLALRGRLPHASILVLSREPWLLERARELRV